MIEQSIDSSASDEEGLELPRRSLSNATMTKSAIHLSWHDMNVSVSSEALNGDTESQKSRKLILNNVFGVAEPGAVTAIMGSSGSGKTTLLNVLTHRNLMDLDVHGCVKVNGVDVERDYVRRISAYVQQDDLFIGSLTVEEHLRFIASLKMGSRYSAMQKDKRVRRVIRQLGLLDVSNTIIGTRTRKGLSGGEKKRLAFASEILTSPPLLFCDEPTSGLDAFLAFQVVTVLQDLARVNNMAIVITIHQPSSQVFELFDSVYLMTEGRVAFCGRREEAAALWSRLGHSVPLKFNPADHYIRTLAITPRHEESDRKRVFGYCDAFVQSEEGLAMLSKARGEDSNTEADLEIAIQKKRLLASKQTYAAGFFTQLALLSKRNLMTTLREPMLLKVQICHSIIIGLLTGLVYVSTPLNQNTIMTVNGALFQCVSNMAFMFQFSVVHHFSGELPVFLREHHNSLYRVSSYFWAKNLVDFPSFFLLAVLFCSVLYWMSPLVASFEAFIIYALVSALVQSTAISVGYVFSCTFRRLQTATALMPVIVVPLSAFAGFFINQDTLPPFFYWLKFLSWFNYGYEALAVNEWTRVGAIPGCDMRNTTGRPCLATGAEVLASMSFQPSNLWRDCLLLIALTLGIRVIAFLALYRRSRQTS